MEWIDIKTRMPDVSKIDGSRDNIIVATKNNKVFCSKFTALGWVNLYGEKVTHWMLLPEPPLH